MDWQEWDKNAEKVGHSRSKKEREWQLFCEYLSEVKHIGEQMKDLANYSILTAYNIKQQQKN